MLALFLNKYVLMALAILAILFGAYEAGKSSGYQKGHDDAWNTQQQTINKMVDAQNAAVQEQNDKISELEITAAAADVAASAAKAKAASARTQIIASYKRANPQTATACGWTIPTVKAINQILNADRIQPVPNTASPPSVPSPSVGVSP